MTQTSAEGKKSKKAPGRKWVKWIVILAVLAVAVFFLRRSFGARRAARAAAGGQTGYATAQVERRTITSALSGSGTLQPADSYTVSSLVEGEILSDTFEEGDLVEKESVLYEIDSSDTSNNIERSRISLEQAQRNYEKVLKNRTLESESAGQVISLNVKVGDKINNGQVIAQLRDSTVMEVKLPFPADDAKAFHVGQEAQVTLDGSFEELRGTVTEISGADTVAAGNSIRRNVTVAVSNPGGLTTGQAATAVIGGVGCAGSGSFTYRSESTINATASGTITALNIKEGDWVSKGETVLTLGGQDLEDQIRNAQDSLRNSQLSMENTLDQLDRYTITSPVSGTVVDKKRKAGDNVSGNDKSLCTIYDLSYLEMTIAIDELDISKISVGQKVTVTSDAVEGKTYEGVVTKVSVVGSTSGGITSYPATIRIDKYDGLLPGMNVDAEIVLTQSENVLAVPSSAVNRGGLVLVTADSPSAASAVEGREAPEGYVYVRVETGDSDDNYIEITSGLQEGDTVGYTAANGNTNQMFMMGMPGMGMGGMPGGGAPGGMPSGGGARPGGSGGSRPSGGGFSGGGRS